MLMNRCQCNQPRASRALWATVLAVSLAGAQAPAPPFTLLNGTPVKLRLSRNLDSNVDETGSAVDFEVLEEVKVNDVLVIPKGAIALATVVHAKKARRMGRAGKLDVAIDHVRTNANDRVPLRGVRESEGGSNAGKMTGAMVGAGIVFLPAAPLFLLWKGKDYRIPKGTEITAYVNGDTPLDIAKYKAVANPTPRVPVEVPALSTHSPEHKALTNEDVLSLKEGGLSDDVIVAKIRTSTGSFKVDTVDMIELKRRGLSDAVIKAMVESAAK